MEFQLCARRAAAPVETFVDKGQQNYGERQQQRSAAALKRHFDVPWLRRQPDVGTDMKTDPNPFFFSKDEISRQRPPYERFQPL